MRALFTADLQLGAGLALGHGEYGPGSRFQDQVDVLDRIATLAVNENVQIVFVLGDVFERARPEPHQILAFQGFVRTLIGCGIRVFCIVGNHDVRSAALPSAMEIFGENGSVVATQPSIFPVDDIVIAALPWTPISNLAAALPDTPRDDLNTAAGEWLGEAAMKMSFRCETEYPHLTPLLVGHWAISGAALPTGLPTDQLREAVIPLEALAETGFALAAFGHIHSGQVLASEPVPVFYTGSPQVNSWGETGDEHGVWVWDSAPPGHLKFHAIEDRRFLALNGAADLSRALADMSAETQDAVVRYRFTATEEEMAKIDLAEIRRDLQNAGTHKVFIEPTVERVARARVADMKTDLSDEAAMELWITSQDGNLGCAPDELRKLHAEYLERLVSA